MLYDPKWEVPVKQEPSLQGFIAWLERQDPKQRYNYFSAGKCAWAQYSGQVVGWPKKEINKVVCPLPWTFGAVLKRARELTD